ncbi:MAG: hypothetical protein N2112_07410 [Gemmataceae bacterium]|jgi:putative peptide zinc metalloprotease protein|nr:hypothetical protein [Gemmataceae bacterium]
MSTSYIPAAERRKQVKLRRRYDLIIVPDRYEGKTVQVVKDPVTLKYYRLDDREFFVFNQLNGENTLEEIRVAWEREFVPQRLELQEVESFARSLVKAGLVLQDSPNAPEHLFEKRRKERRLKNFATYSNPLYIKLPLFDPDRLLNWMISLRIFRGIFTYTFLWLSVGLMLSALLLVIFKYKTFHAKLPAYQEFFAFKTLLYMWISLGIVKVIHEFGHGLSCKAFGGESHEMGALFMCFSPALYCNVTDAWTAARKWERIVISFAGIWVELVIASIATWVWWYTPQYPFINNVAMCLMVLCSVSTIMFNANPLMKFDGYYILQDLLEVPNLKDRSNRYLGKLFQHYCLGIEVQPEPYMARWRKFFFVIYAITSFIYRIVITVSILIFLATWLKPYKLEIISLLLALVTLATMIFWPTYKMIKSYRQRGRLPDMNRPRTLLTTLVIASVVLLFLFLPTPFSRIKEIGLVQVTEGQREQVFVLESGILIEQYAFDGDRVNAGADLARFRIPEIDFQLEKARIEVNAQETRLRSIESRLRPEPTDKTILKQLKDEKILIESALSSAKSTLEFWQSQKESCEILKAPRGGIVMNAPRREDRNKPYQKGDPNPFCLITEPNKIRVLVPVDATQYQDIRTNLDEMKNSGSGYIPVSILPKNSSDRLLMGRILKVPDTDEKNVPVSLTNKGGGTLATKTGSDPNIHQPLVQTYLIPVEIDDPDDSIVPGTLATVKIHVEWRSLGFLTLRYLASVFDIGIW